MRLAFAGATALLLCAAMACGSGDAEPRPTPTLLPPEISPVLRILGEGSLQLEIQPGGRRRIEPLKLAQTFGTPPDCASLVFLFRWRMNGDDEVRFEGQLRGSIVAIEHGNNGSASVGCMVVEAVNDGDETIHGDLRYYVAESR